jgi:hypothetical protein
MTESRDDTLTLPLVGQPRLTTTEKSWDATAKTTTKKVLDSRLFKSSGALIINNLGTCSTHAMHCTSSICNAPSRLILSTSREAALAIYTLARIAGE